MKQQADMRLAVLIDADNIPYSNIKGMLDEIAKFGNPTIKRIYGDWTKPTVSGWKQPLLEHAITPIQQYSYTTGKNATDSAMIIDAMDILHSDKVDGFCLVSSDSDFTRLAVRLRESGMLVLGMGERKTPNPFIVACDKFIYIEILEDDIAQQDPVSSEVPVNKKSNVEPVSKALLNLLKSTVRDLADDDGWAYLGEVGNLIIKKRPDFDPRNYGFPKLTPMIKAQKKIFEIDQRDVDNKKHAKLIYVRVKDS
ncbi:NYN domain-containing protein [Dysgonomonas sp. BGC7]|uniref:NYN domain-containing protein n=1 Tax=Dysgonomonas sp. BGC7 TaxID=1658008 RepID=UPI00068289B7|nr:NYN domain-containing protein [Dysgonomonas sp. BGC7]MBD8387354.1 NYN domain-containing protein [Dysgonomonas sp. BGC7]